MELKVWVEGIQRIVCGVTEKTTCQDVVYALAHATGKTGRFTLIERWRNNERLLAPQEHPLKVLQKWGEYMSDVQFILKRSALDSTKPPPQQTSLQTNHYQQQQLQQQQPHPLSPQLHRAKFSSSSGLAHHGGKTLTPFEAVWKPPPSNAITGGGGGVPNKGAIDNNRLSPDSGRGSDKTGGSDTSNSYSDKESQHRQQQPTSRYQPSQYCNDYGLSSNKYPPPAYRPPPPPTNTSPSMSSDPPPYRAPPPPPPPGVRFRPPIPTSPTMGSSTSTSALVRAPHYSPPPVHRTPHLGRHPSKSSLIGGHNGGGGATAHHHYQQQQHLKYQPGRNYSNTSNIKHHHQQQQHHSRRATRPSHLELSDLYNLISAQQSALQSQQVEMKKYDSEMGYLESQGLSTSSNPPEQLTPSLDVVLSEVRRLEEVAQRNDNELRHLGLENGTSAPTVATAAAATATTTSSSLSASSSSSSSSSSLTTNHLGFKDVPDSEIREEITLLKQRLVGTDQELQKTNATLRHLSEEMRSMSMEKSKQKEQELMLEVEKLQEEIKSLQKSSEEGANISQHLSKEVQEIEEQIRERKSEVEKLMQEMRDANMETLVISPPEESKQFLDGPPKPGSLRKMLGSPRQLENAVPTSKNPHGVWV